MTQTAEFEEKTYEKYFGHEIVQGRRVSFSPGQHAENVLGFDEAFMLPWHIFFRRFRHLLGRSWTRLEGVDRADLERLVETASVHLPNFRFNLFVQFKRPEYVQGSRGAQRREWARPYYRYAISDHQQNTLKRLYDVASGRAAIVYASPAFWSSIDLFEAAKRRQVVPRSNIVSVQNMSGHKQFTYIEPGGHGKAHSESVGIESSPIEQVISLGLERDGMPFNRHIKDVAGQIREAVKGDDISLQLFEDACRAVTGESRESVADMDPASFFDALVSIEAFADAFNTDFYAMG